MKLSKEAQDHIRGIIGPLQAEIDEFKDKPEWKHDYEIALELLKFLKTGLDNEEILH